MKVLLSSWQFWAALSACFAALTAIFGKIAVENINSDFATLIRTVIILAVIAMLFVVLYFASYFGRALSETMRTVMTRIMGMILLAIAVEMTTTGLRAVFPGLA